jgi:hypothetical protein
MLRAGQLLTRQRALTLRFDGACFHGDAGSLLPGLLAATRTGLAPAGGHELMHGSSRYSPPPLSSHRRPCRWAQHRCRECLAGGTPYVCAPSSENAEP